MIYDVFISHSSKQSNIAVRLADILEHNGNNCWYAPRNISPNSSYAAEITKGIDNAKIILLLLSKEAHESEQVKKEIGLASSKNKLILIIDMEIQCIQLSDDWQYWTGASHRHPISIDDVSFYSKLQDLVTNALYSNQPSQTFLNTVYQKITNDLSELSLFDGKYELFSIQNSIPELIDDGFLETDVKIQNKRNELLQEFIQSMIDNKNNNQTNECHALLGTELKPKVFDHFSYKKIDYMGIKSLRSYQLRPKIISAGAITISSKKREVYYQKRSNQVATYKGYFHILGGNTMGDSAGNFPFSIPHPDITLLNTISRELIEETQARVSPEECKTGTYAIACETDTGFIQFIAYAVDIKDDVDGNWESMGESLCSVSFDEFENFLLTNCHRWVPSGLAHVLTWLALGAPKANGINGQKIYESVIQKIKESQE